MAKIKETLYVVKLSQLVKENGPVSEDDSSLPTTIEEVVQQLVGPGVIVEVEKA